jgi:hypothetical protein
MPNGALDIAHGGQMIVKLQSTAATQPTDSTAPTASLATSDFNFMRNKKITTITLKDKVAAETALHDVSGTLLRRTDLYGDQLIYDVTVPSLLVPGPGRMLTEDHRPSTAPSDQGQNPLSGQGTTAFQWNKQLTYDQAKRLATIEGGVVIVHRPDGENPNQMRMDADSVTAELMPVNDADGNPTDEIQLGRLTAEGNIRVVSGDTRTIRCTETDYDPAKHLLICRGTQDNPVLLLDAQHPDNATVSEVWLNTQTNLIEKITNISAHAH